jgi:pyruvate/2-oxoglutarate/acetoin dehydrogenase E1 component
MEFPITIRMPYGGGVRAPELHDDSPEAYYVHTPGVKVAIPSTPADAKGLLAAAIRDPDPVVVFEPKLHYRTMRGEVPEGEHVVPLGKARLAREGSDLTLVAYGAMVPLASKRRTSWPGRRASRSSTSARSSRWTRVRCWRPPPRRAGRDRAGSAAHGRIRSRARRHPRGEGNPGLARPRPPRHRLRRPVPLLQIEDAYMPSVERVAAAARKLLEF